MLRVLLARVKGLVSRRGSDAALDDDIQAHLELLTRDYMERGLTSEDARRAARRAFGGVAQMKETYRDQRGARAVDEFLQDVRYAGRMLVRNPGFATVAVLSLAVGIGAATTAFSVFNAVMLRPLPVAEPDRLVLIQPYRRGNRFIIFNPIYEDLRARQSTLAGVFAVNDEPFLKMTFDDDGAPAYVRASLVSGSYFSVLGVSPSLGRLLTDRDDEPPATSGHSGCAIVISHRFWTRRFQQDPDVIHRTARARQATCAIVGVAAAGFESHQSGYATDVWLPLRPLTDPALLASRGMAFFSGVMGRLAPGVTTAQAEAELTTLYQHVQADQPEPMEKAQGPAPSPGDFTIHLAPGAQGLENVRRQFGQPLLIVLSIVVAVLLIACANVANLLLARGSARLPELATRAALGAGRGRIVRQLATEGALLGAVGGALGVSLAWVAGPALGSLVSDIHVAVDARVITAAIAATLLTVLFAGVLPAVRLSRSTLQAGLAREGRSTISSSAWLMRSLVAIQLALSLLLVSAAGLLLRTMVHLAGVDPGFAPEHVVMLEVRDEAPRPSFGAVETAEQKSRRAVRYQILDQRLNALPGVRSASVSWLGLFSMNDLWLPLIDADRPDDRPLGRIDYVSSRYFETMGMQILRGRGFSDVDREGTERVAVVNETLARVRFGAADPLGRRIALDYRGEEHRPFTIVGVVRDSKYNNLREDLVSPMMWVPIVQAPFPVSSVALRTLPGGEDALARQAQEILRSTRSLRHGAKDNDAGRPGCTEYPEGAASSRSRVRIRGTGRAAGGGRIVWDAGLCGESPDARDRRQARIRRSTERRPADDPRRCAAPDARRARRRRAAVARRRVFATGVPLRRDADRSRNARGGVRRVDTLGAACGVSPGASRRGRRSDRRAALGVRRPVSEARTRARRISRTRGTCRQPATIPIAHASRRRSPSGRSSRASACPPLAARSARAGATRTGRRTRRAIPRSLRPTLSGRR